MLGLVWDWGGGGGGGEEEVGEAERPVQGCGVKAEVLEPGWHVNTSILSLTCSGGGHSLGEWPLTMGGGREGTDCDGVIRSWERCPSSGI